MSQFKSKTERFEVLDTFRGLAATIVTIFHYTFSYGFLRTNPFIAHGYRFVDFFFVLSGFIIYFNYEKLSSFDDQKKFITKRIFRLYPLHVFVLFLFLMFEIFKAILYKYGFFNTPPFTKYDMQSFGINLLMLQGIVKDSSEFTWNVPSWSISVEFINYIFFAALLPITSRIGKLATPIIFFIVSLIALLLVYIDIPPFKYVLKCTYGFFLGCVTLYIYKSFLKNIQFTSIVINTLECLSIALLIVLICFLSDEYSSILSPFYCFVILVFSREGGFISNFLKNKFLLLLGALSYSIYMNHVLIAGVLAVIFLNILKLSENAFDYTIIIFLSIVFGFSYITYNNIELKAQLFLKNKYELILQKIKRG